MEKLQAKYPPHGQCILGERALMINVDGSINFCTQVEDAFNLGNVFDGFDYEKIHELYFALESLFSKQCYGCWAIRLCSKCIKEFSKGDKVDGTDAEAFCQRKQNGILSELIDYIDIREKRSDAFDYLNDLEFS